MTHTYKQTDVGMIPADWEVKRLGEVLTIKHGKNQSQVIVASGMIPIYGSGGIIGWASKYLYDKPSVLIGRKGTIDSPYYMDIPFWTVDTMFYSEIFRNNDAKFIFYIFNTIDWYAYNEASGVPSLNAKTIESISIPLPPLPEQRAIAAALSDVDALIGALEALIAKKRAIKQATMQQLLTGQTRLPGFATTTAMQQTEVGLIPADWEVKRLGEVGEIASAGVDKKIQLDELPVRLVNYLDVYRKDFIYSKDLNHWVSAPLHQARRCAVQKGDVFFTPTSETRDDIAISAVAMEDIPDAAYSYHVTRLRLDETWDLRFRTYIFKTQSFLNQAQTLCDGSGTRYVISQAKFRNMIIQVPPLAEQTAIAAVLSDMDAELAALEAQLHKTRTIKQGMMQELLTGRTRLPVSPTQEEAHAE